MFSFLSVSHMIASPLCLTTAATRLGGVTFDRIGEVLCRDVKVSDHNTE